MKVEGSPQPPEVRVYIMRMSREIENKLYQEWNRLVHKYPNLQGWILQVTETKTHQMGLCSYGRKLIIVSQRVLSEAQAFDTLYHECAHALTPGDKHGQLWRRWAKRLGAHPRAKSQVSDDEFYVPEEAVKKTRRDKWVVVFARPDGTFEQVATAGRKLTKMDSRYVSGRKSETNGKLWLVESKIWNEAKDYPKIIKSNLVR